MTSPNFRIFGLRPTLWPTVFTIPALIIILSLGFWQLARLQEKQALIALFEARISVAAETPPAADRAGAEIEFQRVIAAGQFLPENEILILGRPFDGNTGFHIIVPLKLGDGRVVMVNRGWIPEKFAKIDRRPEIAKTPVGPVEVNGLIRLVREKGRFVPDNEPARDMWFRVVPAEIAAAAKISAQVLPYYIDQLRPSDDNRQLPIGATTTVSVRNDHLQYAITWFSFAISLAVIYVLYHRRREKDQEEDGDASS